MNQIRTTHSVKVEPTMKVIERYVQRIQTTRDLNETGGRRDCKLWTKVRVSCTSLLEGDLHWTHIHQQLILEPYVVCCEVVNVMNVNKLTCSTIMTWLDDYIYTQVYTIYICTCILNSEKQNLIKYSPKKSIGPSEYVLVRTTVQLVQ